MNDTILLDGAERVLDTAKARHYPTNPLDKFELGIRSLIESFMIQRLSENDQIVSRYMDDREFQNVIFPLLARDIFETICGSRRAYAPVVQAKTRSW